MPHARPLHLLFNNQIYFITARTFEGRKVFNTNTKKALLLGSLKAAVRRGECLLLAWVVLDNHYHMLLHCPRGENIPTMMHRIHGRSSYQLNRYDNNCGRVVWRNYWDYIIRDQNDYNAHLNYIYHNPVKHGCVDDPRDYPFVWIRNNPF